jgi:hypothetical protein
MEEGVDYVLNDFWLAEMNRVRKEYDYSILKDRKDYIFSRKGQKLFVSGREVFDFKGKTNLAFAFAFALTLTFALPFTFAFTLSFAFTLAFALQYNGIEKLNKDTCEGKIVEIDGKKYKLTVV